MHAMREFMLRADAVLRDSGWSRVPIRQARSLLHLIVLIVVFGALYGAVMGTYAGVGGDRLWQMFYSATKVPLLLVVTFALSVPSFFVLSTLLGLREDFAETLSATISTQAGLTIILAALAPFTAFWYVSVRDYQSAILFNGVMFAVASFTAQILLRRKYRLLIARRPRHTLMLRVWLTTYCLVGIQMGWVLRPFIGNPMQPTGFFRPGAWSNAYVNVAELVWSVLLR